MKWNKNVTIFGNLLRWFDENCYELRQFAFRDRTIFEIIFLLVYTIEQAVLISLASEIAERPQIVSYFALIVLLTFGLHKLVMESRMKVLENKVISLSTDNELINYQAEENFERYWATLKELKNQSKKKK